MSEPKRYTGKWDGMSYGSLYYESLTGEWVKWEDYALLKAELARLKAGEQPTEWRHYRQEDTNK